MSDEKSRRRWINIGELIALAALIVSAVGVWIAWQGSKLDKPTRVVEQRAAIPLALRATADSDGRSLTIMPADPSHALQSLKVSIKGASPIDVGSEGRLMASDVDDALAHRTKEAKDTTLTVPVRIAATYVEAGAEKHSTAAYMLRYRWGGGGLFGGRQLALVGLSR
jgi:hypothetical protein